MIMSWRLEKKRCQQAEQHQYYVDLIRGSQNLAEKLELIEIVAKQEAARSIEELTARGGQMETNHNYDQKGDWFCWWICITYNQVKSV